MDEKTVIIRSIEPRDAPQAAKVWSDGLDQTIDAAPADQRESYEGHITKMREEAFAEGGSVGLEGCELVDFYCHDLSGKDDKDCRMFVAVRENGGDDATVLGLIGVKRGMHHKDILTDQEKNAEDYGLFSVWKLSVANNGRRLGIGKRLMDKVEEWVKGCPDAKAIRLFTGNSAAADFYTSPKVGFTVIEKYDHYGLYEKKIGISSPKKSRTE
mmetsp:Transcript_32469/g.53694  ORF Transcript_32469/g.53694 Transcript_32469/m.53694 type:complete len:213 (-) Transcript_32469:1214-1852(-)|eukprot:CAMPEP_0119031980 /NCGR_PEP_ID=MMETSP1176-20130426/41821_1 /TAXON_ID=265551 /ORGANISM="Synedropsis recta cf, Strain CCMP1620" /LENGTH=212 /DNA_ID=CAMNT_0006988389 /DNA_START=905 /DNA_END=1543 /DNA_ORIENTATION=+